MYARSFHRSNQCAERSMLLLQVGVQAGDAGESPHRAGGPSGNSGGQPVHWHLRAPAAGRPRGRLRRRPPHHGHRRLRAPLCAAGPSMLPRGIRCRSSNTLPPHHGCSWIPETAHRWSQSEAQSATTGSCEEGHPAAKPLQPGPRQLKALLESDSRCHKWTTGSLARQCAKVNSGFSVLAHAAPACGYNRNTR